MTSFLNKLELQLDNIKSLKDSFLSSIELYYHDLSRSYSNLIVIGHPTNHWGQKKDGHDSFQLQLRKSFKTFLEYYSLIEPILPEKKANEGKQAIKQINSWIEEKHGAPGSTLEYAINRFNKELNKLSEALTLLGSSSGNSEIILVPDTNALLKHPELADYSSKFESTFVILITPTVIAELDSLKVNHRNESVREKAKSVINRFKGYKNQGDVIDKGITIAKKIKLKMIPYEPKFDNVLSWLDPNNNDDRIIATVLDIEIRNITSEVILLTSDLNLQNKALVAGLAYKDIDELFD